MKIKLFAILFVLLLPKILLAARDRSDLDVYAEKLFLNEHATPDQIKDLNLRLKTGFSKLTDKKKYEFSARYLQKLLTICTLLKIMSPKTSETLQVDEYWKAFFKFTRFRGAIDSEVAVLESMRNYLGIEAAVKYTEKYLAYFNGFDKDLSFFQSQITLCGYYLELSQSEKAKVCLGTASNLGKKDPDLTAVSDLIQASSYVQDGDFAAANKIVSVHEKNQGLDPILLQRYALVRAKIELLNDKIKEGLKISLDLLRLKIPLDLQISTRVLVAQIYLSQNEIAKAKKESDLANSLLKDRNSKNGMKTIADIFTIQAYILFKEGKYAEAIGLSEKANGLLRSLSDTYNIYNYVLTTALIHKTQNRALLKKYQTIFNRVRESNKRLLVDYKIIIILTEIGTLTSKDSLSSSEKATLKSQLDELKKRVLKISQLPVVIEKVFFAN